MLQFRKTFHFLIYTTNSEDTIVPSFQMINLMVPILRIFKHLLFFFGCILDVLSDFCSQLRLQRNLRLSDAAVSRQFLLSSMDTLGIQLSSERSMAANEKALLAELNRFRSAVRDIALGKNLQNNGTKLSKVELKEIAARNSDFLDECDRVRSYVKSLSLRNYSDE